MGQQIGATLLAVGGEIIGAWLGGPVGAVLGGLVGGLIGSLIFNRGGKPYVPDINLMQSSYGNPIPIIYGTVRVPATVVWMDQIQVYSHKVGGKGLGGGGQNAYSYLQDAMMVFCEGPANMVKLFLDGKLWIDNTAGGQQQTSFTFAIREYDGDETQLGDFLYRNWVAENVNPHNSAPAYRGVASLVFQGIDLAHFGTRFPQVTAVYSTQSEKTAEFAAFVPWPSSGSSAGNAGYAVDWIRQVLYTVQTDGTVRSFSLGTQQQLAEAKPLYLNGASLTPFTFTAPKVTMLATGNGTGVYGVSGPVYMTPEDDFAYGLVFFSLDPNTLANVGNVVGERNHGEFPSVGCVQLICDRVEGNDFIVGQLAVGGIVVASIDSGTMGEMVYYGVGVGGGADVQFGARGSGDIWIASWSNFDATSTFYLTKTTVAAAQNTLGIVPGSPVPFILTAPWDMSFTPSEFGDGPNGGADASIVYDASDGSIIVSSVAWTGPVRSFKWDPTSETVIWSSTTWSGGPFLNPSLDGGLLSYASGIPDIPTLVTNGAELRQSINPTSIIPNLGTRVSYNSFVNAAVFLSAANGYQIVWLRRTGNAETPIATIITDLCARVGLQDSDIDVSALTQTVWGYAVTAQKSAGAALADICHTFQVDMVESDYTLKFLPRGQSPVATLTQADLGSTDTNDAGLFWQAKKAQELEMPLQINVKYQDPNLDYNPGSEYARRTALPVPTVFTKRKRQLDLPVVATALEARQIAETWLYTMWAERDTYDTVLSMEYLWLDPGDNVVVTLDNGNNYPVRAQTVQTGADMSMQITFNSEDATTYAASTSPGASYGQVPQIVVQGAFGQALLFNVPLLQDSDDTGGLSTRWYFAAGSYAPSTAWTGGGMFNSTDGDQTWNLVSTVPGAAVWGQARAPLPNVPCAFATDRWNSVTIAFVGGVVPPSCSYTDLMNGLNPMLLGSEIVQFMNVLDNGDGTVTLSGLARGRRGTEGQTGSHVQGETAILLTPEAITSVRKPVTEIGHREAWILVPSGRYIDQVPPNPFTYLGYDLFPYAPVALARAPSGSDLVLSWLRRTRLGGWMIDGVDTVPLNETSEAYDAYVIASEAALAAFDPTNSATYVRAFTGLTSPTVTYTAAEMSTDGFTPATDTLFFIVYQLSGVIGRGFQAYKALPAF